MFDPHINTSNHMTEHGGNWEKDVRSVSLEPCDKREDPMGLRAVFYVGDETPLTQRVNHYRVGASYLRARLEGIRRAGYEAPMTERAIALLEANQNALAKRETKKI